MLLGSVTTAHMDVPAEGQNLGPKCPSGLDLTPTSRGTGHDRRYLYQIYCIEDLFLRPAVKKAIILLLSRGHIKVLKDALAHSGPYQTLM